MSDLSLAKIRPKREPLYYFLLFAVSCINVNLIYAYLFLVFLEIRKGSEGYLKMCVLFTIRQVFYFPGLPVITSTQSTIKLALYTIASIIILIEELKKRKGAISKNEWLILVFGLSALISAFFFGTFPVAGAIKVLSFTLVMFTIMIAWKSCSSGFDLLEFLFVTLTAVLVISLGLVWTRSAYMLGSTGWLFRGIWNHPNDFGVVLSIYLALVLYRDFKNNAIKSALIIAIVAAVYLSKSRGALIAVIVVLIINAILAKNTGERTNTLLLLLVVSLLIVLVPSIRESMIEFFRKGTGRTVNEVISSRDTIVEVARTRFLSNPLFGRGLLISYVPGERLLQLFEDGTEPGNIFVELLAGTGIVGTLAFFRMVWSFFKSSKGKAKLFPAIVIAASISEVSFFSVNNYAVIYYIVLALSISGCAGGGRIEE